MADPGRGCHCHELVGRWEEMERKDADWMAAMATVEVDTFDGSSQKILI